MSEAQRDLNNEAEIGIAIGYEAINRLDEMGLTPDILREAVQKAYTNHASHVTEHEPRFSRGITMYCKVTGYLREASQEIGWAPDTYNNFELTVKSGGSSGSMAIMVAGGDNNTGQENQNPCTVSSKGEVVKHAIDAGQQLALFDLQGIPTITPARGPEIWVLLYHIDQHNNEIRLELSRPVAFPSKMAMEAWSSRIILEPIAIEGQTQESASQEEKKTDEIDISVEER